MAVWVAKADPSATRTTKDVDLLVNRADLDRITDVFNGLGFKREDLRSLTLFLDPDEPSRSGRAKRYGLPTPIQRRGSTKVCATPTDLSFWTYRRCCE